jgi:hypothetical protein
MNTGWLEWSGSVCILFGLLWAVGLWLGQSVRMRRLLVAASIGALGTQWIPSWLESFDEGSVAIVVGGLIWLIAAILMLRIGYGSSGIRMITKQLIVFSGLNGLAAVIAVFVAMLWDGGTAHIQSARLTAEIESTDLSAGAIFGALATGVLMVTGWIFRRQMARWLQRLRLQRSLTAIHLRCNGRHWQGTAFIDSGNMACEPYSGQAVLIMEKQEALTLQPACAELMHTQAALHTLYAQLVEHSNRQVDGSFTAWRIVPYRTISPDAEPMGMLAFRATHVHEQYVSVGKPVWVAVTEQALDPQGRYRLIVPGSFAS